MEVIKIKQNKQDLVVRLEDISYYQLDHSANGSIVSRSGLTIWMRNNSCIHLDEHLSQEVFNFLNRENNVIGSFEANY